MNDSTAGNRPTDRDPIDAELEELLDEMVRDWNSGTPHPWRAYLERRPRLAGRPEAIVELINQEVVLRRMRGEAPRASEYLAEFPGADGSLERLFEVHDLGSATLEGADPTIGSACPGLPPVRAASRRLPEVPGYEVERLLGRGGMGVVYLARHRGLNRRVALKLMQESRRDEPDPVDRFRREAEAAARCQHPNLVQIHDVGEHDGEPYLALEYVAGGHLGRALAGEPQPPRKAAELLETLARAIDHAHAHGVVHRDLKPANVLITPDGQPKITDFGLAKLRDSTATAATEVGTVLGTLAYMAPEQIEARSGEVGPRTDIHALGAILYEALTGRPPYRAETPQQVLHAILAEDVVAPSLRRPGVPRDLEAICRKCLEKEPARRYATAADLAEDLRRFLDGRPTEARPPTVAERCARWCRRNRWAVAAIAALLLTTTLSAWQAVRATIAERRARAESARAEIEAETAQATNEFLTRDILGRAWLDMPPSVDSSLLSELTVRTAMDLGTEKIGERFRGRPLVEAAIRFAIGQSYLEFRLPAKAAPHFERAVALRTQALGANDPRTLIARCRLGITLIEGRPDEAERHLVAARDGLIAARGPADPEALIATQALGALASRRGKPAEAIAFFERAVTGLRASRGPAHPETIEATTDLFATLLDQKEKAKASDLLKESLRLAEEAVGAEHPDAIGVTIRLAPLFLNVRDTPEMVRRLEDVLRAEQSAFGKRHHNTILTMGLLATAYLAMGRGGEAEEMMLKALNECRKEPDRYRAMTSLVTSNLASYYIAKRDLEKAREHLCETHEITRVLNGQDSGLTDSATALVSQLYMVTRELAAERYLHDHLAYLVRHFPDGVDRYITEGWLGYCLLRRKADSPRAEASLRLAVGWITPRIPELPPENLAWIRKLEDAVIEFYEQTGRKDQAAIWRARRMDLDFPASPLAPSVP